MSYEPIPSHDDVESGLASRSSIKERQPLIALLLVLGVVVVCATSVISHRSSTTEAAAALATATPEELVTQLTFQKDTKTCSDPMYAHRTLKIAHEMPVVALVGESFNRNKFEASCVHKVGSYFYTVDDDSPAIARVRLDLQYKNPDNVFLTERKDPHEPAALETSEGGYEALFYDHETDTFSAVVEAVSLDSSGGAAHYHAVVQELKMDLTNNVYTKVATCPSDYEFKASNKGFEGAIRVKHPNGDVYMLGLCEGNFCEGGARGRAVGNGRMVVLKKQHNVVLDGKTWPCAYVTQGVINLPASIKFADYSAVAVRGERIAIVSQENAQVWIGRLDVEKLHVLDGGITYDFPRDGDCNIIYCNVEGVDWVDDNMLVLASDQMKDAGRQSFRCLAKDQSIHVMVVPPEPEVA